MDRRQSKKSFKHYVSLRHILVDFVYVVIIDTLIALFLSATGISNPFGVNLLISQCYGITIFAMRFSLLRAFDPGGKACAIILIIAVGVVGGYIIGRTPGLSSSSSGSSRSPSRPMGLISSKRSSLFSPLAQR